MTVQLLDKDGKVIATTTTDKDGKYSFEHLPDGTYSVRIVKDASSPTPSRPKTRTPRRMAPPNP